LSFDQLGDKIFKTEILLSDDKQYMIFRIKLLITKLIDGNFHSMEITLSGSFGHSSVLQKTT
jgi:hypothetical protein